jgi:hypothetical protein
MQTPPEPASAGPGVEAIFVPTNRPVLFLETAARLAQELGCTLVTLHSGRSAAGEFRETVSPTVDLFAIDVPQALPLNLPLWETSQLLNGTIFASHFDISPKRNIALMLSHMLGWSRVLFLDDDIIDVNPQDIYQASGLLGLYCAVGLSLVRFPDNSVVCHAYRLAGGSQQSFVGAGALALDARVARMYSTFFPDIYNEDWFFLLGTEKRLLPTASIGQVNQVGYDPFDSPDRARNQEFGDVLAEGIYWLLDQDQAIGDADLRHWTDFLNKRRQFIEMVTTRTEDSAIDRSEKKRRLAALKAAEDRLREITPELCEQYVQAWTRDRVRWREHLDRLPTGVDRMRARAELRRH